MGIEDRNYYRDESEYGYVARFSQARSIVTTLIIINVAMFVIDMFTPVVAADADGGAIFHWLGSVLALRSDRPYFIWNWLTYGFAHAPIDDRTVGIWHLLGNMLTLYFLGRPVEMKMGSREFLSFYLVAIVFSGLCAMVMSMAGGGGTLIGASGAVTAVVAVFIMWFPKQTLLIWGILPIPAWALGVLMVVTNLGYAFSPGSHVSWEAHAFGALFGIVYLKSGMTLGPLGLDRLKQLIASKPKLRLHDPDAAQSKLQQEADEILEKINRSGEGSLTSRERRTLNKYSQSLRKNREP